MRRPLIAAALSAAALAVAAPGAANAATDACARVGQAGGVVIRGVSITAPAPLSPPCLAARQLATVARNRLAYGNTLEWTQSLTGSTWRCEGGRNNRKGTASVDCRRSGPAAAGARVAVRATLT